MEYPNFMRLRYPDASAGKVSGSVCEEEAEPHLPSAHGEEWAQP